jgi:hypothetical protein
VIAVLLVAGAMVATYGLSLLALEIYWWAKDRSRKGPEQ